MRGTLKRRRQFALVYEKGKKAVGRHVVAFALCPEEPSSSSEANGPTVGYVASRKVGNAVRRNRAKRLLRAAFRPLESELPSNLWVVLVARASLAHPDARSHEVTRELEDLFHKMDLLPVPSSSRHA